MLERYMANTNFRGYLKTNKKLIKNWNELLLVSYSESNKFNQNRFGRDQAFQMVSQN